MRGTMRQTNFLHALRSIESNSLKEEEAALRMSTVGRSEAGAIRTPGCIVPVAATDTS